ncbi:four-carbon acid sugar kinase family protein [Hyunsoonleella ulvae]|uniref:four-carbon acid sugar kinase family protein n=1 Tax=Hyunsoonleella ulvae TaxID=2799948 RepID=UPI00193AB963|nr:four-carbon acid sugar kinase family protein [Hyunsoonleella ulvae]
MSVSLKHITKGLPSVDTNDYRTKNKTLFSTLNKILVVIDDDPTGNQTVYDIPLLSSWSVDVFVKEFLEGTPVFYVLTNSRSLTPEATFEIYKEIAKHLLKASELTQKKFIVLSRSDSTLRGHFPLEPETLQQYLNLEHAITVFIPVMFEGNRITLNSNHYIKEEDVLTPVNETPFAQDHSFSYSKSNLKEYIEEKSKGKIKASEVFSFSIEEIREYDVQELAANILEIPATSYCVFDSLNYSDLDKVTSALLLAESQGKHIIYRTSSSFVPSYIGLKPKGVLMPEDILDKRNNNGGLTIVGSYVKKSSEQLANALSLFNETQIVEVDVSKVLLDSSNAYIESLVSTIDDTISKGQDVIVFTSRKLITGTDANDTVDIASKISNALVDIVKGITARPKYLLAKGGITSHDLATKGLGMKRSKVLGQIQPGIPTWEMGTETKLPKLPYIVFPGNVGDTTTLQTIITKLKTP